MKAMVCGMLIGLLGLGLAGCGDDDDGDGDAGEAEDSGAAEDAGGGDPAACMMEQCAASFEACMADETCATALQCTGGCDDPDPELVQACQIDCTVTNASPLIDDLFRCTGEERCLPPSDQPCPVPGSASVLEAVSLGDLEGAWYVVRGLNRTYDCWSCQKMTFENVDASQSTYYYDYSVYSGAETRVECTTTAIPFDPNGSEPTPGRFRVDYLTSGLTGRDEWYMLGRPTADSMLIYYCGATPVSSYRGAVLIARSPDTSLSADALAAADAALAGAGIDDAPSMADFCTPDNAACAD